MNANRKTSNKQIVGKAENATRTPKPRGKPAARKPEAVVNAQAVAEPAALSQFQTHLLDHVSDAIVATDLQTRVTYWNRAAFKLYGWTAEEALGRPVTEVTHSEITREQRAVILKEIKESGEYRIEATHHHRDGRAITVEAHGVTLRSDAGEPTGYLTTVRDITERNQAQDALRASENRFRILFENSPVAIWEEDFSEVKAFIDGLKSKGVTDLNAHLTAHPELISECIQLVKVLDVNQAALKLYETQSQSDLLGGLQKTFPAEALMGFKNELLTVAQGKLDFHSESRVQTFQGRQRDVSINWVVVPGYKQTYAKVLVSLTDITERKQAEVALSESEERYRVIFEDSPLSIWEEDFSSVKQKLVTWRRDGVTDFRTFFDQNPDAVAECAALVKVIGVNKATLKLFGAQTKADLLQNLDRVFTAESYADFKTELLHIAEGKTEFRWEGVNQTLTGERINVDLYWLATPGNEETLSRVIVSLLDITKRKQAEDSLRDREQRLNAIIQNEPECIKLLSSAGEVLQMNPAGLAMVEADGIKDVLGKSIYPVIADEYRAAFQALTEKVFNGESGKLEFEIIGLKGTRRWLETHAVPMRNNLGEVIALLGITRDSTERKQAEAAERAQRVLAEALRDTSEMLNSTLEYGQVLDQILNAVGRVVPHDSAVILLVDKDHVHTARSRGYDKHGYAMEPLEVRLPVAETTNLRTMFETREAVVISDTASYPGWVKLPGTDGLRSNVGAPILIQGEVIGFILLNSETPGFFTALHAERLKAFANQAALAIHNARLLQQAQDEIAERKRAQQALAESEALYRRAIEVAGAVPYYESYYDNYRQIKYDFIGEGIREITGYGPEEFSTALWDTLVLDIHPVKELADYPLEEAIRRVRSGATSIWQCEFRIRHRNGEVRWVFEAAVELRDEQGVAYGSIGTYQDITERKLAEEKIHASEARYRALFENAPDGIFIADPDGNYIDVNQSAGQLLGYTRAELIGMHISNVVLESEAPRLEPELAGIKAKQPYQQEWQFKRKDDSVFIGEVVGALMPDGNLLGFARDITERKRAENKVRASEERFQQLANNIQEGFWITDAVTGIEIYLSPAIESIWGIPIGTLMNNPNIWVERVIPEDRHILLDALDGQRKRGIATELEYRIARPDGSVRWIWDRAFPIQDENGNVTLVTGIAADITERKQAEEAIRQSEEKVQNIIRHSSSMFYTHTPDHVLTYVSPQSRQILGCEPEEAMVRWSEWLSDNPINLQGIEATERAIQTGQRQPPYELELITETGRTIWVQVDESPVVEAGKTVAIVGSLTDITERKQAENSLRENEVKFAGVINSAMDAVISVDSEQRIVLFNPAAEQIFGYTASEAIGQMIERLIPERYRFQHKKHLIHFGQTGTTRRSMGHLSTLNGLRCDGTEFPMEASISHIEVGEQHLYTVILRDITEHKQAQEKLSESETRYRALFDSSPISLWEEDFSLVKKRLDDLQQNGVTDLQAHFAAHPNILPELAALVTITDANKASLELYRVERKEDLLTSLAEVLHEDTSKYFQDEILGLLGAQRRFTWEGLDKKADGTPIEVVVSGSIPPGYEADWSKVIVSVSDITERKQIENELRARDRLLRESQHVARLGHYHLDISSGRWESSDALNEVFGIDENYLTDVNGWAHLVHPADRDGMLAYFTEHVIQGHNPFDQEYRIIRFNDGRERWVHGLGQLELDEQGNPVMMIGTIQDITERKVAEAETLRHLIELETLFENGLAISQLLDSHQIGNRIIETVERYLSWHHVTIRLRRAETDELELIAFNLPDINETEKAEAGRHFRNTVNKIGQGLSGWVIQTGAPIRTGNVHAHQQYVDTHEGIQSGMYVPLKVGDNTIGCISVESKQADAFSAQDERLLATLASQAAITLENARLFQTAQRELSERIHAEELLEQERNSLAQRVAERTTDLSRANANLARALRVKDEFLANMSHELRTPLNAILGLSESLSEQLAGPLNEKQQRYVATVNESGHHLLSLINDILDLAKIEANQITLDIGKVDVRAICDASLRMIKQLAQKKNQEVALDIDPHIGVIWTDERRLKQMIVNLLSNAVKFTPESGRLGLEVRGNEAENKVMLTVWDTGIGIKQSDLSLLFKPFVQLDGGLAREASGTGLGLALVAQMASLHGGSVSVESEPGKGSRFTISIPWEPALTLDTAERLKVTGKFRTVNLNQKQPTILMVEDTKEVVMVIRDYLEMSGYKIAVAGDGIEGIEQAKLIRPDLILMDLQMPRMDGLEATRRLRNDHDFDNTPIIALTALAMSGDRERCLAAGMDEYISKPVNLKALAKIIQKILSGNAEAKPQ